MSTEIKSRGSKIENTITLHGITFSAVRKLRPVNHWLLKNETTGEEYSSGTARLKSHSRPALWASLEDLAQRVGAERFMREFGLPT